MNAAAPGRHVRSFDELSLADVAEVGGKAAALGELRRCLAAQTLHMTPGFAVTATAFRAMLDAADAWPRLRDVFDGLDRTDTAAIARAGAAARVIVRSAPMPAAVETAVRAAWRELSQRAAPQGQALRVAVRSSATAEDLPQASFAGQHESFLDVEGEDAVVDAVRRCQASLYTDRAIAYRIDQGFDHFKVALAVAVMPMVRADLASSGVIFTLDPESGHPDIVLIHATWGLGETLVQGAVDPDEYLVHKPTFLAGHRAVLAHRLGSKQVRMVRAHVPAPGSRARPLPSAPGQTPDAPDAALARWGGAGALVTEPVPEADRRRACLDDTQVLALAQAAITIEDHWTAHAGHPCPMDIEWAQDGDGGPLCIVQARPETVASRRRGDQLDLVVPDAKALAGATLRISGRAVGDGAASGVVRRIAGAADLHRFRPGEVMLTETTTPDWEPVMKTAAALVTERGGRTCHAAIVARELGIPAVVGATGALAALIEGETVTVSCAEGEVGRVYAGEVPMRREQVDTSALPRTRTRLHVNLGNPSVALRTSRLPSDGVGLARIEFIVSEHIRAHPMALLQPQRISSEDAREQVRRLWAEAGFADGAAYFVQRLAEGVGLIAAAFWPRPVIVRLSDFKSNEYAALAGGADFEPPAEANPMLGLRGAARYLHPSYAPAFALECQAVRLVREVMGLRNVELMVPFCRRLDEARAVLAALRAQGLHGDGLRVVMMCEIPNNVVLIDEFAELFDGFSIGSNDLTQLTLGVDRDSALLADAFDDGDPGMLKMYRWAIEGAHRHGRHIGICGQAPSDRPEIARALVGFGIDSLSVSPDRLIATRREVAQIEQDLGRRTAAADGIRTASAREASAQAPTPTASVQGRRANVKAAATTPTARKSPALQNS